MDLCKDNQSYARKIYRLFRKDKYFYKIATASDFLSIQDKEKLYYDIIKKHNKDSLHIGSSHFYKSFGFNTDDLPSFLVDLLEEEHLSAAFEYHSKIVFKYIDNNIIANNVKFYNSLILLGPWHKEIWQKEQQIILQENAPKLIQYLRSTKNHLSIHTEKLVLNWYKTYGWTNNWNKDDWENFIFEILELHTDLYEIRTEDDFRIKIRLFNQFNNNIHIRKLALPLCKYIIQNIKEPIGCGFSCPLEIDDDFTIPKIETDDDYFSFTFQLEKEIYFDAHSLVSILYDIIAEANYDGELLSNEHHMLFSILEKYWNATASSLNENSIEQIASIIKRAAQSKDYEFLSLIGNKIAHIKEELKSKLFNLIIELDDTYLNLIITFSNILYTLTNLENIEIAKANFEKIKNKDRKIVSLFIRLLPSKDHVIYHDACEYPDEIFDDGLKNIDINNALLSIDSCFHNLENIMAEDFLCKEAILETINQIENWVNNQDTDITLISISQLKESTIKGDVINNLRKGIPHPPIFHQFIIEYLLRNKIIDFEYIRSKVINAYTNENLFWRFFFELFCDINGLTRHGRIIIKNNKVRNAVINSLETELKHKHTNHQIENELNKLENHWIPLFVRAVETLYENRIPAWFNKDIAISFVAFPKSFLYTYPYSIRLQTSFNAFDWLKKVADIPIPISMQWAIDNYSEFKDKQVKSQILEYFLERYEQLNDTTMKNWLDKTILDESIKELYLDYENGTHDLNWVLSRYWQNFKPIITNQLIEILPIEKYESSNNPCRNAIFNNILLNANSEQKALLIQNAITTSFPHKEILLIELGFAPSIERKINHFLRGGMVETKYDDSIRMFGTTNPNKRLLKKYVKLLQYACQKNTYRRNILYKIAKTGIKNSIDKFSFRYLKIRINSLIKKYRKYQAHYDLLNFINEIEQYVFESKSIDAPT